PRPLRCTGGRRSSAPLVRRTAVRRCAARDRRPYRAAANRGRRRRRHGASAQRVSAQVEPVAPDQRLRIAILGDFDGVHTRAWLRWFVERGHEVHAISYYAPAAALVGVTFHILRDTAGGAGARRLSRTGRRPSSVVPPGLLRLVHGARYLRAGIGQLVRELRPDVFHGHFLVEHGFYGALAGFHPYVVT